jgi:hypothetical protein
MWRTEMPDETRDGRKAVETTVGTWKGAGPGSKLLVRGLKIELGRLLVGMSFNRFFSLLTKWITRVVLGDMSIRILE